MKKQKFDDRTESPLIKAGRELDREFAKQDYAAIAVLCVISVLVWWWVHVH